MADDRNEQAASSKSSERSNGGLDPARQERDRQVARDFRQMTQSERLQDKSTNPAAKQIAAIDAAIDQKYGRSTPEAARMKAAAREAVAQTLERGGHVRAPRIREVEPRRDETREQHHIAAEKSTRDLDR